LSQLCRNSIAQSLPSLSQLNCPVIAQLVATQLPSHCPVIAQSLPSELPSLSQLCRNSLPTRCPANCPARSALPHRSLACGLPDGFLLDLGNGGVRLPTKLPSELPDGCPVLAHQVDPVVAQLVATSLSHSPDFGPPNLKNIFGSRVKWGWFRTQSGDYGRWEVASSTGWDLFLALIVKVADPKMFSPQHGFGVQIRRPSCGGVTDSYSLEKRPTRHMPAPVDIFDDACLHFGGGTLTHGGMR
jgi:hypothetical protein